MSTKELTETSRLETVSGNTTPTEPIEPVLETTTQTEPWVPIMAGNTNLKTESNQSSLEALKKSSNYQRIVVPISSVEVDEEGNRFFEGEITNSRSLANGYRYMTGGGDLDRYENNPVLMLQHGEASSLFGSDAYSLPIGTAVAYKRLKTSIQMKFRMASAGVTEKADEVWNLIEDGVMRGLSMGVYANEIEVKKWGGENEVPHINSWELLEVSVVTIPANKGTIISKNGGSNMNDLAESIMKSIVARLDSIEKILSDKQTEDKEKETKETETEEQTEEVTEPTDQYVVDGEVVGETNSGAKLIVLGEVDEKLQKGLDILAKYDFIK